MQELPSRIARGAAPSDSLEDDGSRGIAPRPPQPHARRGAETRGLGLEIPETSRMEDFAAVAGELQRLMAMGIELWLDDFGTGHSSLDWLSRLPCHGVKIPCTFVARLFTDDRCRAIVSRVVQ